jgi:heme/copper-type cytochrome/quinol oxidase subunit 4
MGRVMNAAKNGFGLALGFGAMNIIGILIFLVGLYLVMQNKKKDDGDKQDPKFIFGVILMVIGVALSFGFGGDQLLNQFT